MQMVKAWSMSDSSGSPSTQSGAIVEQVGDLVHHVQDRLTADLRRVSGDHGADAEILHDRPDQRGGHLGGGEAVEAGGEAAGTGRAAGDPVVASTPFEMYVLGGVGQQRQPVERPDHVQLLVDRATVEQFAQLLDVAGPRSSRLHGHTAHRLDEIERLVARLASHDVAQQPPQQPDVRTERRIAR